VGNLVKQDINKLTGSQNKFNGMGLRRDTVIGLLTGFIPEGGTALKGAAGKLEKGLTGAVGGAIGDAAGRLGGGAGGGNGMSGRKP
jgi:hypothetical protein